MPTKKHRYMIILDEQANKQLSIILKELNTKQRSKGIKFAIMLTSINLFFSTTEQVEYLKNQIQNIKEHL